MTEPGGIILVHGYTGSADDLAPLAEALRHRFGPEALRLVHLPGHDSELAPAFDGAAFLASIQAAAQGFGQAERRIALIGHSTGGSLVLAALSELGHLPALVVLAATPKSIDAGYGARWQQHRARQPAVARRSLAAMISLVNAVGAQRYDDGFSVLVLHGAADELVPPADAQRWTSATFAGPTRQVLVPGAEHDLFHGPAGTHAVDLVVRAVADALEPAGADHEVALATLMAAEPAARDFLAASPASGPHLARSPSGRALVRLGPELAELARHEPIIANIEITNRCNARCRHCARSFVSAAAETMPRELFTHLLDLLPHAYRVTLVGLGEPLLHPEVVELVAELSARKRRAALVTNGMLLDPSLSRELVRARLGSIAFSLDAPEQALATSTREGTDLPRILENIRAFQRLAAGVDGLGTAVFAAVSVHTLPFLERLVDLVAELGVQVLMLTDLNYAQNLEHSLWRNRSEAVVATLRRAVARAFSKGLPVLGVHSLEDFGLAKRYRDRLLLSPARLCERSARRTFCHSPWQTLPIDVRGNVTFCDCQPELGVGNLLTTPLTAIWNGPVMAAERARMLGNSPPEACAICPRF